MWFNGEDRDLPNVPVAEPLVVTPAQSTRPALTREVLCGSIAVVAAAYDLPGPFFANLIQQESGFRHHVISRAGAQGIAQFMPRTARAYGLENPFDTTHSLSVSARFLSELLGQFGNLGLAAAAYNAGPTRVQNWMARRGPLPEETRNYVLNITGHPAERWARIDAKTEGTVLPSHARCPDMPATEVSVPEAAPVKVAKGKGKGKDKTDTKANTKAVVAKEEGPKLAAAKEAGPKMPKSYTLASMTSPGRTVAVIANGKLKIMAPEKGAKPKAEKATDKKPAASKTAAKDNKPAAKSEAKSGAKVAAKTSAKPAAKPDPKAKSPAKSAAKSQSKPGKRVKLATAR
jgi:hypothetical protein